jgi:hypothetical protein
MTAATTATTPQTPPQRPTNERRTAARHRCLSECLVRIEGAAEPLDWPGMIYNISATGIAVALPFPAPTGTVLVIEPRRPAGRRRWRARVVRGGLREYVWFHGCQFVDRLGEDELRRWLAPRR